MRLEEDLYHVGVLERQITQIDEEIDRQVYSLYGLTEEEFKIVEATHKAIKIRNKQGESHELPDHHHGT